MFRNHFQARFADPVKTPNGLLKIGVFANSIARPVSDAKIIIKQSGSDKILDEIVTNVSGQTEDITLDTPPLDYSINVSIDKKPYSEYDVIVEATDFEPAEIENVQILPDTLAIQNVMLTPRTTTNAQEEIIVIKPHTLWGDYPPKIPESEEKPLPKESGFVVLDKPVIPEYIVVHDGSPNDTSAKNYYIPFKDYIKNVASSEIYSTWPKETIIANVLAIISFTLNRVFTEWYRAKGKNFTITSSTAYDHAFFYGRNIYKEISVVVDDVFNTYITRPNIIQPLFTQYCDGKNVQCPNWMEQWGSKNLGDIGYSAINILRSYYGQDIYLTGATKVTGIPSSYPGKPLTIGSTGKDVRTIQTQLNAISNNFPLIKKVPVDGNFQESTKNAVQTFQTIFNLYPSGVVDFSTWYKISDIYVAVSKLAELV